MSKQLNVFMIGWEYPPHNSGGLGVACQGITEALAERNHKLYFTLPYTLSDVPAHMNVMACRDPHWETEATAPPFFGYSVDLYITPLRFKLQNQQFLLMI